MDRLKTMRAALAAAQKRAQEAVDAVLALADDAPKDVVDAAEAESTEAEADVERCKAAVDKREALLRSREAHTPEPITPGAPAPAVAGATAKGELRTEQVYRIGGDHSFLRDVYLDSTARDQGARERLLRSNDERRVEGLEYRDMSTTLTAGGDFLPPIYLANLWVVASTSGRPVANVLPRYPLPLEGIAISVPSFASGVSVDNRADNGTVSETDGVTATIAHNVREISGQVDVGRIDVMRSNPSMDQIVMDMLFRRYNAKFDDQLINGTGAAQQHIGLRAVTSPNTVAYTDASPTAAELVPKLYDAIQKIDANSDEDADLIIGHPRRTAWLASNLSSTFPLFQLGSYLQAAGSQDQGFTQNIAGLDVVKDRNVQTLLGAGTEDEIYVLARKDFIYMEGPLQTRVFEDVGSGTGTIRYQVFAHSAFLSNRYPKSLTIISGTGLIAPSF